MSPKMRRFSEAAVRVADLKTDGEYAYGKVWGLIGVVLVVFFHAIGNAFPVAIAFLVVAAFVGPGLLHKLFERISISIGSQHIDSVNRAIIERRDVDRGIDPAP